MTATGTPIAAACKARRRREAERPGRGTDQGRARGRRLVDRSLPGPEQLIGLAQRRPAGPARAPRRPVRAAPLKGSVRRTDSCRLRVEHDRRAQRHPPAAGGQACPGNPLGRVLAPGRARPLRAPALPRPGWSRAGRRSRPQGMVPPGVGGAGGRTTSASANRESVRADASEPRIGAPGAAELLVGPGLESGRVGGIEPPGVTRSAVRPRIGGRSHPDRSPGSGVARPRSRQSSGHARPRSGSPGSGSARCSGSVARSASQGGRWRARRPGRLAP